MAAAEAVDPTAGPELDDADIVDVAAMDYGTPSEEESCGRTRAESSDAREAQGRAPQFRDDITEAALSPEP
eukprot:5796065-Alexandrium_andersonii.AAC.1